MAEGGMLAWKVQKLNVAPTLSYKSIHKTLGAPKGKRWNFDPANKEWSLVDKEPPACCIVDVDAVVITESVSMDETSEKATMRKINDDPLPLYVEHYITPEDTFQGICLRYKIKPFELRRANGFTGENLKLMNNPLKIPRRDAIAERVIDSSRHMTQSEDIMVLLEKRKMKRTEATAYSRSMTQSEDITNGFTGENLKLMNNPLKIPRRDAIATRVIDSSRSMTQSEDIMVPMKRTEATAYSRSMTQSEDIMVLLKKCKMKRTEATAYLMLSDWDLAEALENARGDGF